MSGLSKATVTSSDEEFERTENGKNLEHPSSGCPTAATPSRRIRAVERWKDFTGAGETDSDLEV